MKFFNNYLILFLLIFVGHCIGQQRRSVTDTSEIQFNKVWKTTGRTMECYKPSNNSGLISTCSYINYPKENTSCSCTNCGKITVPKMHFRCGAGHQWYPITNDSLPRYACGTTKAAGDKHRRCNICPSLKNEIRYTCNNTAAGKEGDNRTCTCISSKNLTTTECNKDGTWYLQQSCPATNNNKTSKTNNQSTPVPDKVNNLSSPTESSPPGSNSKEDMILYIMIGSSIVIFIIIIIIIIVIVCIRKYRRKQNLGKVQFKRGLVTMENPGYSIENDIYASVDIGPGPTNSMVSNDMYVAAGDPMFQRNV